MANITLNAAPGLTTVSYKVEWPVGTFSASKTDAVEVQPGRYDAPRPAQWVSVYWSDGVGGSDSVSNDQPLIILTPAGTVVS